MKGFQMAQPNPGWFSHHQPARYATLWDLSPVLKGIILLLPVPFQLHHVLGAWQWKIDISYGSKTSDLDPERFGQPGCSCKAPCQLRPLELQPDRQRKHPRSPDVGRLARCSIWFHCECRVVAIDNKAAKRYSRWMWVTEWKTMCKRLSVRRKRRVLLLSLLKRNSERPLEE